MNLRLLRWGDVLAFAAGVGLLFVLGLEWYGGDSGWEGLPVLRFLLALVALSGIALGIPGALERTVALPVAASVVALPLGLLATLTLLVRTLFELGGGIGAGGWLGLLCVLAISLGAFRSMKDEGTHTPHAKAQAERVLAVRGAPRPAPPAQAPVTSGPTDPSADPAAPRDDPGPASAAT
ncbi:MAG: hypothetical protein MSC31_01195 [Solirubrobacteraceae bacterium MAG38_C4-C5]|nr:hypothetical protein [Candidatus Siliceabacter maunaloa]